MEELKFSYNWNGKLYADCFTTIRRRVIPVDTIVKITLKGEFIANGKVIYVKKVTLAEVAKSLLLCYIDTGYPPEQAIPVFKRMHKINETDFLYIHLVKKI